MLSFWYLISKPWEVTQCRFPNESLHHCKNLFYELVLRGPYWPNCAELSDRIWGSWADQRRKANNNQQIQETNKQTRQKDKEQQKNRGYYIQSKLDKLSNINMHFLFTFSLICPIWLSSTLHTVTFTSIFSWGYSYFSVKYSKSHS